MRSIFVVLLLSVLVMGQQPPTAAGASARPGMLTVPAGTKVPVVLKQAISTKTARVGDAVYAQTAFPVARDNRILIPAGTYVQGTIQHLQRPGRVKGRAEVLLHFTTLIFPNGYTVLLPGSVDNVPGAERERIKGSEGTIQEQGQRGEKVGTAAGTAATGAVIGGLSQGGKGAAIGAGIGGAAGLAIAMLTRGRDVRLDAGTSIEMVIQRDIPLQADRIQ